MAKRNYSGSKSILSNDRSKHANLPGEVMFKGADNEAYSMSGEIGDEMLQIQKQLDGDHAKAKSDYKLRKA